MLRRYPRLFIGLGVVLILAIVVLLLNATYLRRSLTFFTQDQVRSVGWFAPTLDVQAANAPAPVLTTPGSSLTAPQASFNKALDYARTTNTSALLVWHQGELALEHYAQGYGPADPVQTNSVHKSVLGMLIGIAIDEGSIESVDDPVENYLDDWVDQPLGQVRIKHLLSMSSGLEAPDSRFKMFNHSMRLLHGSDIAEVAREAQQTHSPGQQFDYKNTNAQLLLAVLEAATGEDYENYFARKLWSLLAEYPAALWFDRDAGTPHGFCCLISTPRDLLRLGLVVLNTGRIGTRQVISKSWMQAMRQPSDTNPNYGYLMWLGSPHHNLRRYSAGSDFGALHSEPYLAEDVLFFDGFGGQRVYVVPSLDLVIVRVGESRFDFDDAILPNRVIEALSQNESKPMAETSAVAPDSKIDSGFVNLRIEAEHTEFIDLRVGYPKGASGEHPLIVFSHGNGLSNLAYDALIKGWVQSGFVVAAPRHLDVGSRTELDALTDRVGRDWVAASRVLDMTAVIDQAELIAAQLPSYQGRLDSKQVIAAGHSFGAYSAQILGGALYERSGDSIHPLPDELRDPRVIAVVGLSSPGVLPGVLTEAAWQRFETPQLVITGTKDTFEFIWTDYRDHFVAYDTAKPGHNHLLVVEGMDHYMGNLIGRPERELPAQHAALASVISTTTHFMQTYLARGVTSAAVEAMASFRLAQPLANITSLKQR